MTETFDDIWREELRPTYKDAISQDGLRIIEKELFDQRAKWLRQLGLDPNNTNDWHTSSKVLAEIERTTASLQASGYPDMDLSAARISIEIQDTIREVQSFMK